MKRCLLKLGVFLLIGAIVNIAVAWGFAMLTDRVPASTESNWYRRGDELILIEPSSTHGLAVLWIGLGNHKTAQFGERKDVSEFPRTWAYLASPNTRELEPGYAVVARSATIAGWPMYSLWCEEFCMLGGGGRPIKYTSRYGGVNIKSARKPGSLHAPVLPLFPIWPGFAINTIVYAGMVWLILFIPKFIRRRVRIRRGRCPSCGYQVAPGTDPRMSSTCSECGASLLGVRWSPTRTCRLAPPEEFSNSEG